MTDEALRRRAYSKFLEERAYRASGDDFSPVSLEAEKERRERLRRLIAEIDGADRELTDDEIRRLAYEYYETPNMIRTIIETKEERRYSWQVVHSGYVPLRVLGRRCRMGSEGLRRFVAREFPGYGKRIERGGGSGKWVSMFFSSEEAAEIEAAVRRMRGEEVSAGDVAEVPCGESCGREVGEAVGSGQQGKEGA